MPARREYTTAELTERLERHREQARVRMARMRARNASRNAERVRVTNTSLHAHDDVRGPGLRVTTTTPKPSPPPPPGGGSKSGEVIDGLRAAGLCDLLRPRDHQAIKASPLSPAQIVEAFGAACRGEWGGTWLKDNVSVQLVIDRYAAFDASRRFPAAPTGSGRKSNGTRILEHLGYVAE